MHTAKQIITFYHCATGILFFFFHLQISFYVKIYSIMCGYYYDGVSTHRHVRTGVAVGQHVGFYCIYFLFP